MQYEEETCYGGEGEREGGGRGKKYACERMQFTSGGPCSCVGELPIVVRVNYKIIINSR